MYFEIVKQVVEQGIADYAAAYSIGRDEVLTKIRSHIDHTHEQHYELNPEISYDDPLCRLGYLYRHAGINATLFERVLIEDQVLQTTVSNAVAAGRLSVCSLGGGPGTELLGLTKYLMQREKYALLRIDFTVLDNVNHWAESWRQLAKATEGSLLAGQNSMNTMIADHFLQIDALDPSSYDGYPSMFKDTDIVVCNYLFSENQTKLDDARQSIARLVDAAREGCMFVVIDRHENDTDFVSEVVSIFDSLTGTVETNVFTGIMDSDEQKSELGDELLERLRNPRVQFRPDYLGRPRVFWFATQKQELPW